LGVIAFALTYGFGDGQALARAGPERDAHFLYRAIKGFGTDNEMLIDVICTKSSDYLNTLALAYGELLETEATMVEDITGATGGHYRQVHGRGKQAAGSKNCTCA
jgi:hypothetical protein